MKIAHVFNLANDGWAVVKGLRALGIDADLIIRRPDHVACLPQWEEAEIDLTKLEDQYYPDWETLCENWPIPDHVKVWDVPRSSSMNETVDGVGRAMLYCTRIANLNPVETIRSRWRDVLNFVAKLNEKKERRQIHRQLPQLRLLGDYDLVIGHWPFAIFAPSYRAMYKKPYLVYDAGWIRTLHDPISRMAYDRLGRAGYKYADKILFANVDTYEMFLRNGYDPSKLIYTSFAIDPNIYRPLEEQETLGLNDQHRSPVFFMPSRQDPTKGNISVLYAFKRYLERRNNAVLRLVNWGSIQADYKKHLTIIKDLEIARNIEWLPLMNKRLLVRYYNAADIVFDQFELGALGTTAPEAMSCGKPVISYVKPELWTPWHNEPPPVANAGTSDEILQQMIALEDAGIRKEFGERGRKWTFENCEPTAVANKQMQVYEETLKR